MAEEQVNWVTATTQNGKPTFEHDNGLVAAVLIGLGIRAKDTLDPKNFKGKGGRRITWRRLALFQKNIFHLELGFHQKREEFQLTAYGPFLYKPDDEQHRRWVWGVKWSSKDQCQTWSEPYFIFGWNRRSKSESGAEIITRVQCRREDHVDPIHVGTTVATHLMPLEGGRTGAYPMLLAYDGRIYDEGYHLWQYWGSTDAIIAVELANGKPTGNNVFPRRIVLPKGTPDGEEALYDESFEIIRFVTKRGHHAALVKGPILQSFRGPKVVREVAIAVPVEPDCWDIRPLPPRPAKALQASGALTAENAGQVIDENARDVVETEPEEKDAVTAEEAA